MDLAICLLEESDTSGFVSRRTREWWAGITTPKRQQRNEPVVDDHSLQKLERACVRMQATRLGREKLCEELP